MNKVEKENMTSLISVIKDFAAYLKNKTSIGLRTPRRAGGLTPLKMNYSPNPFSGRAVRTTSESLEDIMMREGRMLSLNKALLLVITILMRLELNVLLKNKRLLPLLVRAIAM